MTLDDGRYTVSYEWCGSPKPMYIARFCEDYIGAYETKREALQACLNAYNERMKDYL